MFQVVLLIPQVLKFVAYRLENERPVIVDPAINTLKGLRGECIEWQHVPWLEKISSDACALHAMHGHSFLSVIAQKVLKSRLQQLSNEMWIQDELIMWVLENARRFAPKPFE